MSTSFMDAGVNSPPLHLPRIYKGNTGPDSQQEDEETKYRKRLLRCSNAQRKRLPADLVDGDVIALPLSQSAGETKTVGSAGRSEREAQRYQNELRDRASLTSAT